MENLFLKKFNSSKFFQNLTKRCEIKTVIVSFFKNASTTYFSHETSSYRVEIGRHNEFINQNPCENEHMNFCSNGECYYMLDEVFYKAVIVQDVVEENVLRNACRGTTIYLNNGKQENFVQTQTSFRNVVSKSDGLRNL